MPNHFFARTSSYFQSRFAGYGHTAIAFASSVSFGLSGVIASAIGAAPLLYPPASSAQVPSSSPTGAPQLPTPESLLTPPPGSSQAEREARELLAGILQPPQSGPDAFTAGLPTATDTQPGTLLAQASSDFTVLIPGITGGVSSTRIAFSTTNALGARVPVTGTVLVPPVAWTGGPRPIVVLAPGTQGTADRCAPSRLTPQGLEYESAAAIALLQRGWAVAMTDYIGLGTPGPHTYMNRLDQGHTVLDMARAAHQTAGAGLSADAPIGIWGYSQGGGAAASAAELHATYAPEVNLKGTYAGGVPADLYSVLQAIDGSALVGAMGYAIDGLRYYDPEFKNALDAQLNPLGQEFLASTEDSCVTDAISRWAFYSSSRFTNDGRPVGTIAQEHVFADALSRQLIGTIPPDRPVMVMHNTTDDIIPVAQARAMKDRWIAAGADVTYQEFSFPPIPIPLGGHFAGLVSAIAPAADWMGAHLTE